MPQYGLCLQVNHTGKAATSIHISDIRDGIDLLGGAYGFRKPGAIYVPTPVNGGISILAYSGDVAVSFETGAIRQFINGGHLTAQFIVGSVLGPAIFPEVQDEGVTVDPATQILNFTGAGVTATQTAAGEVQVDIPGGGGPRTDYGVSATDPTVPPPSNGDLYYNSVLDMEMRYDATRGKWLSIEADIVPFGRDGPTGVGQYYRAVNNRIMSATIGWYGQFNGTVVSLAYTRSNFNAATFEVMRSGVAVHTVPSAIIKGRDPTINADFVAGDVLAVRNQNPGSMTMDVVGWMRVKWRI
jgi:hypothetical protein